MFLLLVFRRCFGFFLGLDERGEEKENDEDGEQLFGHWKDLYNGQLYNKN